MGELIETYTQKDKLMHMLISAMLTLYIYVVLHLFVSKAIALATAVVVTIFIGGLKEHLDSKSDKHVSSKKDFAADVFGVIITAIPLIFI